MGCWCVSDVVVIFMAGVWLVCSGIVAVVIVLFFAFCIGMLKEWWDNRKKNDVRVYASLLVCETCLKRIPAGYIVKKY